MFFFVSRGEKLKAMAEFQKEYEKRKDDMGKKRIVPSRWAQAHKHVKVWQA